jgi:hypothetical protein
MRADDTESREQATSSASSGSADEAARQIWTNLTELLEYGSHFVTARADRLRLAIRKAVLWSVAGLLGAIALVTLIVVSVAHLMSGLAQGLGSALDAPWAGSVIVGGAMIVLLGLVIWRVARSILVRSRKRTVSKYEQRKDRQRDRFGHTVAQRAHDQTATRRV